MCGLTGWCELNREPSPEASVILRRMNDRLAHRGPDAEGFHIEGPVALGHRRLSVIDLEASRQPMSTPDGALTIVFNGEIYNFESLRDGLIERGHVFRTRGDTEVLLHLYREHGSDMLRHLHGMFAFAIWDRPRQRLFIARDHLGVKPLHYAWDGRALVFGSELKAVLEHPSVSRDLDLQALGLYLECQYIPAPHTIHRAVRKLEPGHWLMLDPESGAPRIERWWQPDYSRKRELGEEQALDALDAALRSSVRSMMVADVPLGCFLSGGIDSSLVSAMAAGLMAEASGRRIDTFTLGFTGAGAASEHEQAREVARHIGSKHHVLMLEPDDLLPQLDRYDDLFDEPFADPAALPTLMLAGLARQQVTVVLTGEGADEVFSGYGNYARRAEQQRWVRRLSGRWSPLPALIRQLPPRVRKDRFLMAVATRPGRRYLTIPTVFDHATHAGLFSSALLAAQRGGLADLAERHHDEFNGSSYLERMMYIDSRLWLPDDLLTKVDRATMAVSLEARVPYLDHGFFEFAASLPAHWKQRGATTKYLLKRLAERYLPERIVHRRKQGFMPPLQHWLDGALREPLAHALSAQGLAGRGLFRPGRLEVLAQSPRGHDAGRRWALLMLERWFERHAPDFRLT